MATRRLTQTERTALVRRENAEAAQRKRAPLVALGKAVADVCDERPVGDPDTALSRFVAAAVALGFSREDACVAWDAIVDREHDEEDEA